MILESETVLPVCKSSVSWVQEPRLFQFLIITTEFWKLETLSNINVFQLRLLYQITIDWVT